MKRLTIILITTAMLLLGHELKAQVDWNHGGNSPTTSEFLGTINAQPLLVKTQNIQRMKLNQNLNYTVNGYPIMPYNGNLLVGINNNSISSGNSIYGNLLGAYSLLHLNGDGSGLQEFGHRPWMNAGVTLTGNRDLSYMGLRKLSTNPAEEDITETVILCRYTGDDAKVYNTLNLQAVSFLACSNETNNTLNWN